MIMYTYLGTETQLVKTIFGNLLPYTNYTAIVFAKSTNSEYIVVDGGTSDPITQLTFSTCTYVNFVTTSQKQMSSFLIHIHI